MVHIMSMKPNTVRPRGDGSITAAEKWGGDRICGIDIRANCFHLHSFGCTQTSKSPIEQSCLSSSPSRLGSKSEQTEAVEEPKRTHTYPPRSD